MLWVSSLTQFDFGTHHTPLILFDERRSKASAGKQAAVVPRAYTHAWVDAIP